MPLRRHVQVVVSSNFGFHLRLGNISFQRTPNTLFKNNKLVNKVFQNPILRKEALGFYWSAPHMNREICLFLVPCQYLDNMWQGWGSNESAVPALRLTPVRIHGFEPTAGEDDRDYYSNSLACMGRLTKCIRRMGSEGDAHIPHWTFYFRGVQILQLSTAVNFFTKRPEQFSRHRRPSSNIEIFLDPLLFPFPHAKSDYYLLHPRPRGEKVRRPWTSLFTAIITTRTGREDPSHRINDMVNKLATRYCTVTNSMGSLQGFPRIFSDRSFLLCGTNSNVPRSIRVALTTSTTHHDSSRPANNLQPRNTIILIIFTSFFRGIPRREHISRSKSSRSKVDTECQLLSALGIHFVAAFVKCRHQPPP
ncbi:hypothetical protein B0J14DRAFT_571056 [Halenospora varia]|nr:hypothetical protein B0J14DRAFT_571056 [Halenospora varia]